VIPCTACYTEANGALVVADEQAGAYVNPFGFRVNLDHSLVISPATLGEFFQRGSK